ncbi:MAG: exodeoxyribonuclease VII large subunit [Clostridia bacterium]
MENILNVSVLNNYIHNVFVAEDLLRNIQVCGEVSGWKIAGGNAFFTLKDENAQISCVAFGASKSYCPRDGESVILRGSVDYYAKAGRISFNVSAIQPLGAGLLALQFEKLKAKLLEKGYFSDEHKKEIPQFCKNVGVITSTTGAVIKDIITTVRKTNKSINLFVYNVKVQGETSAKEIVDALDIMDKLGYDAIIIARGGGSVEDLLPFNNENLVYKIFDCATPIISAVGHETDFTLCDLVSDVRCPTPTASGQLVAYDEKELATRILTIRDKLRKQLARDMQACQSKLDMQKSKIKSAFYKYYSKNSTKIELIKNKISNGYQNLLLNKKNILQQSMITLETCNPIAVMTRGFWIVEKDNFVIAKTQNLKENDKVVLIAVDGKVSATVNNVENNVNNNKDSVGNKKDINDIKTIENL